jgi:predicted ArsR family transcriptional regulator
VATEQPFPSRELTDPRAMRALAHPRRLDLLEVLFAEGPLTASQCAERVGDSPASCSYHLRQLAKWGFVEETGEGRGRERPWRHVPMGNSFGRGEGAAARAAAELLIEVIDDRRFGKVREFRSRIDHVPAEWVDASHSDDFTFWATAEETAELGRQIFDLLAPYQRRALEGVRPPGSRLVQWLLYAFPLPAGETPEVPDA